MLSRADRPPDDFLGAGFAVGSTVLAGARRPAAPGVLRRALRTEVKTKFRSCTLSLCERDRRMSASGVWAALCGSLQGMRATLHLQQTRRLVEACC